MNWISVKDRLPEVDDCYDGANVLVCLYDGEITVDYYQPAPNDVNRVPFDRYGWGTYSEDAVTHWMPLPEPPEAK